MLLWSISKYLKDQSRFAVVLELLMVVFGAEVALMVAQWA
jgi:hypothetical protein